MKFIIVLLALLIAGPAYAGILDGWTASPGTGPAVTYLSPTGRTLAYLEVAASDVGVSSPIEIVDGNAMICYNELIASGGWIGTALVSVQLREST